jgi:hypothetical protein
MQDIWGKKRKKKMLYAPEIKSLNRMKTDIPLANFIFRATDGGKRIATARDTLMALRSNPTLLLKNWFFLEAAKFLIQVQEGKYYSPVQARILYGRWMADCPECNGANDVDPNEPVFLCTSCGWPGMLTRVLFPENSEAIEHELLKRPRPENRNWKPGESLLDLELERVMYEHG